MTDKERAERDVRFRMWFSFLMMKEVSHLMQEDKPELVWPPHQLTPDEHAEVDWLQHLGAKACDEAYALAGLPELPADLAETEREEAEVALWDRRNALWRAAIDAFGA